jgi:hypothetical protein
MSLITKLGVISGNSFRFHLNNVTSRTLVIIRPVRSDAATRYADGGGGGGDLRIHFRSRVVQSKCLNCDCLCWLIMRNLQIKVTPPQEQKKETKTKLIRSWSGCCAIDDFASPFTHDFVDYISSTNNFIFCVVIK